MFATQLSDENAGPELPVLSTRPAENPKTLSPDEEADTEARIRRLEHRLALVTAALQKERASPRQDESDGNELSLDGETNDARDVADPVFEAAVLDIVDRERERKEEERATWRKQLHGERGKRYATELAESLQLTEQQQDELAQTVAEHFEHWRALREDESPDRPATRSEWRKVREQLNGELERSLKTILGPEQFARYEELDPEKKLGWGGRERSGRDTNAQRNSPSPAQLEQ